MLEYRSCRASAQGVDDFIYTSEYIGVYIPESATPNRLYTTPSSLLTVEGISHEPLVWVIPFHKGIRSTGPRFVGGLQWHFIGLTRTPNSGPILGKHRISLETVACGGGVKKHNLPWSTQTFILCSISVHGDSKELQERGFSSSSKVRAFICSM